MDADTPILPQPDARARSPWWTPYKALPAAWRRAARPRWGLGVATDEERRELGTEVPGRAAVTGAEAQDYLAWRRCMLAMVAAIASATGLIHLVEWIVEVATTDPQQSEMLDVETMHGLAFVLVAANLLVALSAWRALARWDALASSHRSLRLGWLVGFLVPFVVALVPVASLLRSFTAGADAETQAALRANEEMQRAVDGLQQLTGQVVSIGAGLMYFIQLLPSVLSVLVGTMRASLLAKRFAPESGVVGWIAVGVAPVFVLLLLAVIVVLNQLGGNLLVVASFALTAAAFLLLPLQAQRVTPPCGRSEVDQRLAPVLLRHRVLLGGGVAVGVAALFTMTFFGHPLAGFGSDAMLGPWALLKLVLEFAGKSMFVALLFTDLLVAMLHFAWGPAQAARFAELAPPLAARFRELEAAGLAGLRRREAADSPEPA